MLHCQSYICIFVVWSGGLQFPSPRLGLVNGGRHDGSCGSRRTGWPGAREPQQSRPAAVEVVIPPPPSRSACVLNSRFPAHQTRQRTRHDQAGPEHTPAHITPGRMGAWHHRTGSRGRGQKGAQGQGQAGPRPPPTLDTLGGGHSRSYHRVSVLCSTILVAGRPLVPSPSPD